MYLIRTPSVPDNVMTVKLCTYVIIFSRRFQNYNSEGIKPRTTYLRPYTVFISILLALANTLVDTTGSIVGEYDKQTTFYYKKNSCQ